jgi:glycosyltransferase involved in cell wall biosynthesis
MKVLCAQRDVLGKIGGGESAATRLFARATDAVFTWPVSRPPVSTLAPNFDHVVVDAGFQSTVREQLRPLDDSPLRNDCADFYEAMSIAHAVRGREFDIVECADYLPYGRFLPFAFSEVGVKYGRLVCSLHGRVSRTLEIENEFNRVISSSRLDALKAAEQQFIFGSADVRYGFSERYVRQAMSAVPLSAEIIDPLCALPSLRITQHDSGRNATVWFVGRQERIKGGDLFLRAIFRAGPELWQRYAMCGPAARLGNRPAVIEGMSFCRNRGMPFRYRGSLSYANVVREVYETGALVVIPSREDTFNLVALEALLNGVPVLISKYAGAADFIRARFGSDFLGAQEFDPYDELTAAATMRTMLRQLDEHRIAVRGALDHTDLTPQPDRLMHVYTARAQHDRSLRDDASRAWERVRTVVAGFGPRPSAPREERGLKPATTQENLFVNRARKYRELAVSEATSRPVVAAAYRLRGFRMQALSPNEVSALAQDLHDLRFREEEASLRLWSSDAQITGYLEQRRQRLSRVDITPAEYIVDRRDTAVPKVSIVVSIYNATKPILEHFIAQLGAVSMVRNRRAEVLFVDSGSTVPQRDLLEAIPGFHQISHLLVRSVERETIQSAWNPVLA